jgi:predicted amidohydrolase
VKVAAYQAPLGSLGPLSLIQTQVARCEVEGVTILCCPEAILGGLADYAEDPQAIAIAPENLAAALASIASATVTTIIGFTELAADGRLFNTAAIFHRGAIAGLYRKRHPAIRHSVYAAGNESPVFEIEGLAFGIMICNDSNFPAPASEVQALFIPTNNGLPPAKANEKLIAAATAAGIERALESRAWVIRSDVTGSTAALVSPGSSAIIDPSGNVVRSAAPFTHDLLIAEINPSRAASKSETVRPAHTGSAWS